ncbi:hypothetical protein [Streptomyces radicis]|uniref:Uncharacterized protein n=1 Tax=Streptomyces radicis TaxID=1750517 RepID=A0A3A9WBW6_9ACTN|nr:hypothetical protein [Streptomyces radicis]RKN05116.1 hypothetical protein D7319_26480 [Streptomyces radicis]RKN16442.1 hypothetical protein D7318_25845 [Streptomyces radicis]
MTDLGAHLSVHALSVATRLHTDHRPLNDFPAAVLPRARRVAEAGGIPLEHLVVASPEDAEAEGPDVSALALAALGPPPDEQPLFLVRSGPLRDAKVAALAGLVHASGWRGEDIGVTHLDELGGALVFDLLSWAMPAAATALICDEPLFADARAGGVWFTAIGLRIHRGPGPLRVIACGEGPPPATPAAHHITGRTASEPWLTLHTTLSGTPLPPGTRILLHTRGPRRECWLTLETTSAGTLALPRQ